MHQAQLALTTAPPDMPQWTTVWSFSSLKTGLKVIRLVIMTSKIPQITNLYRSYLILNNFKSNILGRVNASIKR